MELTDLLRAFESGDFARPNLFEVEIPFLGKNFSFKCKAAAMPPANVDKIAVGFQNRKLHVAGDRTFDDWSVTIYSDDKHQTRQDILDWQNLCHGQGAEISGATPADYKKTAIIRQFGRDGKTITKEYTIYGLWPTLVGEVQLDWDQNSEVETFETTFALDYWL
ncbi:tail tube protein [Acinetobacter phage KARL-1]|uniref:Tail tube protein n=7 Tax=Lazarusvirus TaxID=2842820 RepID=A0A385IIK9_9CAUD|nr:tail protein [Acinetobacter phage KARL-1]YP_009886203.1 tail protein [Acinetobacter phage vB_AbaM_Berthold]YP_009886699.1 tail protein [Acinetobacter phage vB_AbaM_Kimel]YP_009886946.1 tail protein [Acinetobacter phage vB_AbaM_Lazarus]QGT54185.1 tail tube protein [Acinetobacter phage Stupor]QKE55876.1 tail tube protein [Acinetobacter phage Octan]QKN88115.1 tail tube protein [Acinetobacter phage Abraxas]QNO11295.1 tail tube protein [Acinetobacter phage Meroveus]AXY82725.1 tail tube protei